MVRYERFVQPHLSRPLLSKVCRQNERRINTEWQEWIVPDKLSHLMLSADRNDNHVQSSERNVYWVDHSWNNYKQEQTWTIRFVKKAFRSFQGNSRVDMRNNSVAYVGPRISLARHNVWKDFYGYSVSVTKITMCSRSKAIRIARGVKKWSFSNFYIC